MNTTRTHRQALASTSGLKITRNGNHAWTVVDAATGRRTTGHTRRQAVEAANRLRLRATR